MSNSRTVTVAGRPVPQGSLRPIATGKGKVVVPQSRGVLTYRNDVRAAWGDPSPHHGAVEVEVDFVFKRPKSHYKGEALRQEFVGAKYTSRPDIDKLVRSVLDALTDWAYVDDSQVVEVRTRKVYGTQEMAVITVTYL